MNPPNIAFKGINETSVEAYLNLSKSLTILIETDGKQLFAMLDLSTAQSLKKHLGWLIAHAKNQSNEG